MKLLTGIVLLLTACPSGSSDARSEGTSNPPTTGTPAGSDKPGASAATPSSSLGTAKMTKPTLDWKIGRTESTLRIDYEGKNTLDQRIYVVDKLVKSNGRNDFSTQDEPIVRNEDPSAGKGVVKVVLGPEGTDRETMVVYSPTYRPIEPGQPFSGSVTLPFPLTSAHPLGGASPLQKGASKIAFKLYYFVGEPKRWTTLASTKQASIQVPEGIVAQVFQTTPKPIP